ncbi:MAG TPA: hypothetical protein PLC42_01260 [Parachlamydiaceae bacterium]|nr:hypothetical protein [Parachlamydiaceae bacterium]
MNKLKLWNAHPTWESAEAEWDKKAKQAESEQPVKKLTVLPHMIGITEETAKHLKWKSLKWIVKEDHDRKILKNILKHPFRYLSRYVRSIFKKKPYQRSGDFFLYGVDSKEEFKEMLKDQDAIFILGFSYCHKPFECPSGRFSENCIHDLENPVCQQCFIGKAVHALPETRSVSLFIPTIHYVGGKVFDVIEANPGKKILFMITACEMTLEMFGDLGNMVDIKGLGIRLDGRICNTMKAFELSEKGIKPGLTVVLEDSQKEMLEIIKLWRENGKRYL